MKNIKTYEGFKKFISKKEKSKLIDVEKIEYFLDDIKDISINYKKYEGFDDCIYFIFFIKDYQNKKNEINLYLEEIKDASKSIDVNFYKYYSYEYNLKIQFPNSDTNVTAILLQFSNKIIKKNELSTITYIVNHACFEFGLNRPNVNILTSLENIPNNFLPSSSELSEIPNIRNYTDGLIRNL